MLPSLSTNKSSKLSYVRQTIKRTPAGTTTMLPFITRKPLDKTSSVVHSGVCVFLNLWDYVHTFHVWLPCAEGSQKASPSSAVVRHHL